MPVLVKRGLNYLRSLEPYKGGNWTGAPAYALAFADEAGAQRSLTVTWPLTDWPDVEYVDQAHELLGWVEPEPAELEDEGG